MAYVFTIKGIRFGKVSATCLLDAIAKAQAVAVAQGFAAADVVVR